MYIYIYKYIINTLLHIYIYTIPGTVVESHPAGSITTLPPTLTFYLCLCT